MAARKYGVCSGLVTPIEKGWVKCSTDDFGLIRPIFNILFLNFLFNFAD